MRSSGAPSSILVTGLCRHQCTDSEVPDYPRLEVWQCCTHIRIRHRRKVILRKWWLKRCVAAESLQEAVDRLCNFMRLRSSQWRSVRNTDELERLHEAFKRRIKVQIVLPSADIAAMLF